MVSVCDLPRHTQINPWFGSIPQCTNLNLFKHVQDLPSLDLNKSVVSVLNTMFGKAVPDIYAFVSNSHTKSWQTEAAYIACRLRIDVL